MSTSSVELKFLQEKFLCQKLSKLGGIFAEKLLGKEL